MLLSTLRLRRTLRAMVCALTLPVAFAAAEAQQTVFLDFSQVSGDFGYSFTAADRDAIQAAMEADFGRFDFTFTQTAPLTGDYSTLFFDDGVLSGNVLGVADKVDFRNLDKTDTGRIQTLAEVDSFDADENLFLDEIELGNFITFTANIASRTVGSLVGLETIDALGPVGGGVDPRNGFVSSAGDPVYYPDPASYPLPFAQNPAQITGYLVGSASNSAAVETINHLMDVRAEQGTDTNGDPTVEIIEEPAKRVNDQYFGPRSAIKLTFNETGSVVAEDDGIKEAFTINNLPRTAQPLALAELDVPTTATSGDLSRQYLEVEALAVTGDLAAGIERDYYRLDGQAGELVNIEVNSALLGIPQGGDRYANTIDSIVTLYDQDGQIVATNDNEVLGFAIAIGDDGIISSDSSLIDVVLPSDGSYYIEVRSLENYDNGSYELFVHRTAVYEAVVGDFNLDGVVDAADYVIWRNNEGIEDVEPYTNGDADGNGKVDNLDLQKWKDNYGLTGMLLSGAPIASAAVPEPAAAALLIAALVGAVARRR